MKIINEFDRLPCKLSRIIDYELRKTAKRIEIKQTIDLREEGPESYNSIAKELNRLLN